MQKKIISRPKKTLSNNHQKIRTKMWKKQIKRFKERSMLKKPVTVEAIKSDPLDAESNWYSRQLVSTVYNKKYIKCITFKLKTIKTFLIVSRQIFNWTNNTFYVYFLAFACDNFCNIKSQNILSQVNHAVPFININIRYINIYIYSFIFWSLMFVSLIICLWKLYWKTLYRFPVFFNVAPPWKIPSFVFLLNFVIKTAIKNVSQYFVCALCETLVSF